MIEQFRTLVHRATIKNILVLGVEGYRGMTIGGGAIQEMHYYVFRVWFFI